MGSLDPAAGHLLPDGRRSGWSFSLGEKVSRRARTDEGPSGPMRSRSRQRFLGSAECSGFVTEQPGEQLGVNLGSLIRPAATFSQREKVGMVLLPRGEGVPACRDG